MKGTRAEGGQLHIPDEDDKVIGESATSPHIGRAVWDKSGPDKDMSEC